MQCLKVKSIAIEHALAYYPPCRAKAPSSHGDAGRGTGILTPWSCSIGSAYYGGSVGGAVTTSHRGAAGTLPAAASHGGAAGTLPAAASHGGAAGTLPAAASHGGDAGTLPAAAAHGGAATFAPAGRTVNPLTLPGECTC